MVELRPMGLMAEKNKLGKLRGKGRKSGKETRHKN
jgi:hypothetical protein